MTVVDVTTEIDETEDDTVVVIDQSTEPDDQVNDNAPVYVSPVTGGENPFDPDVPTEVDEHDVDEFIGEGDDRPGEGIHF